MRKRCHFSELTQPLPGHRAWRVDSGLVSAATYCPGGAFMQTTNCMGAHGNPEYKGLGQGSLPLSKGWSINRSHSALGPSAVISLEGSDLWRRVEGGKKKKKSVVCQRIRHHREAGGNFSSWENKTPKLP